MMMKSHSVREGSSGGKGPTVFVSGSFGGIEVAREVFMPVTVESWTGSRSYVPMHFCNLKVVSSSGTNPAHQPRLAAVASGPPPRLKREFDEETYRKRLRHAARAERQLREQREAVEAAGRVESPDGDQSDDELPDDAVDPELIKKLSKSCKMPRGSAEYLLHRYDGDLDKAEQAFLAKKEKYDKYFSLLKGPNGKSRSLLTGETDVGAKLIEKAKSALDEGDDGRSMHSPTAQLIVFVNGLRVTDKTSTIVSYGLDKEKRNAIQFVYGD